MVSAPQRHYTQRGGSLPWRLWERSGPFWFTFFFNGSFKKNMYLFIWLRPLRFALHCCRLHHRLLADQHGPWTIPSSSRVHLGPSPTQGMNPWDRFANSQLIRPCLNIYYLQEWKLDLSLIGFCSLGCQPVPTPTELSLLQLSSVQYSSVQLASDSTGFRLSSTGCPHFRHRCQVLGPYTSIWLGC